MHEVRRLMMQFGFECHKIRGSENNLGFAWVSSKSAGFNRHLKARQVSFLIPRVN